MSPLAGLRLTVNMGPAPEVGPATVAVVTVLAGLAACGLLSTLERLTRRPAWIWIALALAVLIVSLAGPLTGKAALLCMHLIAAAVLVPGLARTARARDTAGR